MPPLPQQALDDGGHQIRPVHGDVEELGHGGAQVGQAQVNHQQPNPRHDAGPGHHPSLALLGVVALFQGALQNDVTEEQGGQHVHGLIPCLNACGRHILHQRGLPHRAHGVHHPYDNEHQEPCQQGRG